MPRQLYSREGCLRCRARRKKCDESRPVCSSCHKNQLTCVWPGPGNLVAHFLPANRILGSIHTTLGVQNEICTYGPLVSPQILQACPRYAISSGYSPLRNEVEHKLLKGLSSFLTMLLAPKARTYASDHSHVLAMSLSQLWVRDALIAFSAFARSARGEPLRHIAYQHYNSAIVSVRQRLTQPTFVDEQESLLVASLFLAMIEIYNPENVVLPLLHFEVIGHLITNIASNPRRCESLSTTLFHRIALESYLYHVSVCSLFYPETNRYTELSPLVEQTLVAGSSGFNENIIVVLDIQVYRVLFGLSILGRSNPTSPGYGVKLGELQTILETVSARTSQAMNAAVSTAQDSQFWLLSYVASEVLHIFLAKVQNRDLLATDESVRSRVVAATKMLKICQIDRAWNGNLIWIITILLCAAYTRSEFEAIHELIDHVKMGFWGADLLRINQIVHAIRTRRERSYQLAGLIQEADHDILSLLLDPQGVLAGFGKV